jgi:LysR family transcriptional activator of nhaA
MNSNSLNYQHLYYFWTVAHFGKLTDAAQHLRLAQPTLSAQIKNFEETHGTKLFERAGRRLEITAEGRAVLDYAQKIFSLGEELREKFKNQSLSGLPTLKVGICDVVAKTLAYKIIEPIYSLPTIPKIICYEDTSDALLTLLLKREIDLIISDCSYNLGARAKIYSHSLGGSGTSFLAAKEVQKALKGRFPDKLHNAPLLVPSIDSSVRRRIDSWLASKKLRPHIVGEFKDSALLKIFGREGRGVFPVPQAIEKKICKELGVEVLGRAESIKQQYFFVSAEKKLKNEILTHIFNHANKMLLQD